MMRRAPRTRAASDSRLLVPLLLSALLLRADACSSNSDCSENAFCSTSAERCIKCWRDWTDAEINACCEGDNVDTFRAMSCADHLDQEFETSSRARCEAACEREDGGSPLVYVAEPQDYEGAQAACAERGGELACISSEAEALGTAWTGDREIWIADSAEDSYDTCTSSDCPCISCALASERKPFICDVRSAGGSALPPTTARHCLRAARAAATTARPLAARSEASNATRSTTTSRMSSPAPAGSM